MTVSQDGAWLVKSGGRIAGPYSKLQLEQLLKTREFSVTDEVAQPFRRWYCVKDVPEFAKVIEDIRTQNLRWGDDTYSTRLDPTESITLSESESDHFFDDRTNELTPFSKSKEEIVYDHVDDDTKEQNSSHLNSASASAQRYKSYAYQKDVSIARQVQGTGRMAWFITGALLFLMSTFVFYHQFIAVPTQTQDSVKTLKQLAMEALALGDYNESLQLYQKAYRLDPLDKDIYVYLGTLQIQLSGQTVEGKRKLQEIVSQGKGVFPKLATVAMGIADIMDGNTQSADLKFKKALEMDSYYTPAKINLGASAMERQEWALARYWLTEVTDQGTEEGAAILMLAEVYINLFRQERQIHLLEQAQKLLLRLMSRTYDYYQESALLLAYIDILMKQNDKAEQKIELILDVDPLQTEEHRHDLFVYRGRISWKSLAPLCLQLTEKLDASALNKTLKGYCLYRGGQETAAVRVIEDASSQGIKEPLVQAMYAHILREMGQETRASVALGKSIGLNGQDHFVLPVILQGRFYTKTQKPELALTQWQELYHMDQKSLVGVTGMAEANLLLKNYSEAQSYLVEGFRLSQSYRPLFRLRRKAEQEGLIPKTNY